MINVITGLKYMLIETQSMINLSITEIVNT